MTKHGDEPVVVRRDRAGRIITAARPQPTSWTAADKRAFLNELAASANVTRSAKAVGRSHASVYALRKRDAAFARGWDEAICEGFGRLEAALLQRAIDGQLKPVVRDGQVVAKVRDYPDAMAIKLLSQHRETVARVRAEAAAAAVLAGGGGIEPDDATARSLLLARLDMMAARLRGDEAVPAARAVIDGTPAGE